MPPRSLPRSSPPLRRRARTAACSADCSASAASCALLRRHRQAEPRPFSYDGYCNRLAAAERAEHGHVSGHVLDRFARDFDNPISIPNTAAIGGAAFSYRADINAVADLAVAGHELKPRAAVAAGGHSALNQHVLGPLRCLRKFRGQLLDEVCNPSHPSHVDLVGGIARPVVIGVVAGPKEEHGHLL